MRLEKGTPTGPTRLGSRAKEVGSMAIGPDFSSRPESRRSACTSARVQYFRKFGLRSRFGFRRGR